MAKTKSENIITVKKLAKSCGKVKAVRGVSFEVKKGEIFGLLRPNGVGKTTTLEMMEGLRKSDSGRNLATDGLQIRAVTMTDAPLKPWNGEKIVLCSETESCHDQAFPVA